MSRNITGFSWHLSFPSVSNSEDRALVENQVFLGALSAVQVMCKILNEGDMACEVPPKMASTQTFFWV